MKIGATTIVTDRLFLRPVEFGDADATAALMTPAISANLMTWPPRMSVCEATRRIIESRRGLNERLRTDWGIFLKTDLALIGWIGLGRGAPEDLSLCLGYWLGEAYQGQGLGREAASAIVARSTELFGTASIEAFVTPTNARSIALLRQLGFQEGEEALHDVVSRGRLEPFVRYFSHPR